MQFCFLSLDKGSTAKTCEGQAKRGLHSSSRKVTGPLRFQDWQELKAFSETSSAQGCYRHTYLHPTQHMVFPQLPTLLHSRYLSKLENYKSNNSIILPSIKIRGYRRYNVLLQNLNKKPTGATEKKKPALFILSPPVHAQASQLSQHHPLLKAPETHQCPWHGRGLEECHSCHSAFLSTFSLFHACLQ